MNQSQDYATSRTPLGCLPLAPAQLLAALGVFLVDHLLRFNRHVDDIGGVAVELAF